MKVGTTHTETFQKKCWHFLVPSVVGLCHVLHMTELQTRESSAQLVRSISGNGAALIFPQLVQRQYNLSDVLIRIWVFVQLLLYGVHFDY